MRILNGLLATALQWQERELFDEMQLPERLREPVANLIRNIQVLVISDTIFVILATDTGESCGNFTYGLFFEGIALGYGRKCLMMGCLSVGQLHTENSLFRNLVGQEKPWSMLTGGPSAWTYQDAWREMVSSLIPRTPDITVEP